MNIVAMVSFIIGLLLIGWVVLANAEASTRWSSYGDREPFPEDHKEHHANLDDNGSRGQVKDRFKSIDNRKTAKWLPKDQQLETRQGPPLGSGYPDGTAPIPLPS